MSETWYRGQSSAAGQTSGAAVGGHDLGDGVYYTNEPKVAEQYADTRVAKSGGTKSVVQVTVARAELGRVLDLTKDVRWQKFLDTPQIPGRADLTPRSLITQANQNYPRFFEGFIKQHKISLDQYDVILAEEFVRKPASTQMCVRNKAGKPSQLATTLQARWQPVGQPGAPAALKTFDITRLTFRPATGPGDPAGFQSYLRGRENRLSNTQAGWAMVGALLGGAIQSLGDVGIQWQIRKAIEETHAQTIRAIHGRGLGALAIVRTKEWEMADFNGARARAFVDVIIQAGVSPEDALNRFQSEPQLLAGPGEGWRMRPSEFLWIG
jgi:hypothetical protein